MENIYLSLIKEYNTIQCTAVLNMNLLSICIFFRISGQLYGFVSQQ
jgi:hypothetical protein